MSRTGSFDSHGSSLISTYSADSDLTTVSCTDIPDLSPRRTRQVQTQTSVPEYSHVNGQQIRRHFLQPAPSAATATARAAAISTPVPRTPEKARKQYGHRIPGWSPDIGLVDKRLKMQEKGPQGDEKTYGHTDELLSAALNTANSSVYMMNYEHKYPKNWVKTRRLSKVSSAESPASALSTAQSFEPPQQGFAVPVKPSMSLTSSQDDGAEHVFSPALPIYRLKSNPVHHASFFKSMALTCEALDCQPLVKSQWVNPNASPLYSILRLSCHSGGVTAVNLVTGESLERSLSAHSLAPSLSTKVESATDTSNVEHDEAPSSSYSSETLIEAPVEATKYCQQIQTAQPRTTTSTGMESAWDEIEKQLDSLQKCFGNTLEIEPTLPLKMVDQQREALEFYAPVSVTTEATHEFDEDSTVLTRQVAGRDSLSRHFPTPPRSPEGLSQRVDQGISRHQPLGKSFEDRRQDTPQLARQHVHQRSHQSEATDSLDRHYIQSRQRQQQQSQQRRQQLELQVKGARQALELSPVCSSTDLALTYVKAPLDCSRERRQQDEWEEEEEVSQESEMQLMSPELSLEARRLKFRKCFQRMFDGKYPKDGEVAQWLQMMTEDAQKTDSPPCESEDALLQEIARVLAGIDESIPGQGSTTSQGPSRVDETCEEVDVCCASDCSCDCVCQPEQSEETTTDDSDEEEESGLSQIRNVMDTCKGLLTMIHTPPRPKWEQKHGYLTETESIRAASSTLGSIHSVKVIRVPLPRT